MAATLTSSSSSPPPIPLPAAAPPGWRSARAIPSQWRQSQTTIGRANNDGTGVNQNFITGLTRPTGLAIGPAGQHIYWANNCGSIGRANIDGSAVNQKLITLDAPSANPLGLAVGQTHIFWASPPGGGADTIGRANKDGTGVDQTFIRGASPSFGVATIVGGYR
jgi:hypothetical protein